MTNDSSDNTTNVPTAYSADRSGVVEMKGGESYQAGHDLMAPSQPGALLQSAHNNARHPVQAHQATGKDCITLPDGGTTQIAVAASLGLLEKRADGTFADLPPDVFAERWAALNAGDAPKEAETQEAPAIEPLDGKSEALLTEAVHNADQAALFGVASAVTAGGDIPEATINRLASSLGKEPAEVAAHVAHVHEAYADQAARSLAGMIGADGYAEFWAWAESACPQEIKSAAMRRFSEGNTKAYRPLAERYIRENFRGRDNAVLREIAEDNPSLRPKWVGDKLIINHPDHGEVDVANALARGWVRLA